MGFEAPYLVADSWYGTKRIIQSALEAEGNGGAVHEKRKFKYRVLQADGNEVLLDTKQLYAKAGTQKVAQSRRSAVANGLLYRTAES